MTFRPLSRLIYVDDSGDSRTGLVVYGWVELAPEAWREILGAWLEHRKRLWRYYGVPVHTELHMTSYALGRGRISKKVPSHLKDAQGTEQWKDLGREVARMSLETMSSMVGLRVGAVYRQASQATFARAKAELYAALVSKFDTDLASERSLGMVFMDGDGSDPSYRAVHRRLSRGTRSIIEDPIYTDSKTSQLMQMADHVAWCANASIAQVPKHAFAHTWYQDHLGLRDPARIPQPL